MPKPEFLAWMEFYKLQPFDDYARFYRPAALIGYQVAGAFGKPPEDLLDTLLGWLEKRPAPEEQGYSAADLKTMRAFGMKPPRRT